MIPTANPAQEVLNRLRHVKPVGRDKWTALCPAHSDRRPSLCIGIGRTGKVVMKCQAGCSYAAVRDALRLTDADLQPDPKTSVRTGRQVAAVYDYTDEAGSLLFQVLRYIPKAFSQRRPDGAGGWLNNLNGVRPVLYHLPDVLAAVRANVAVYIVEGEKDADTLRRSGFVATTAPGGAGKWRTEFNALFTGAEVVIVPDNDGEQNTGRRHGEQIARALHKTARFVRVITLPDGHKDVSAYLAAGGTADTLRALVTAALPSRPLDASMQPVLKGLGEALQGLPVQIEADGLPTLTPGAGIGDVTAAIRKAEVFRRKSNVVIGLFIGALGDQAANTHGAQKQWAVTAFGESKAMYQRLRECISVYRAWRGIFDINTHQASWQSLLLGARRIFTEADRRDMVQRPKMPTGPELAAEIERRIAAKNAGALDVPAGQQIEHLLAALVQQQGESFVIALLSRAVVDFSPLEKLFQNALAEPEHSTPYVIHTLVTTNGGGICSESLQIADDESDPWADEIL